MQIITHRLLTTINSPKMQLDVVMSPTCHNSPYLPSIHEHCTLTLNREHNTSISESVVGILPRCTYKGFMLWKIFTFIPIILSEIYRLNKGHTSDNNGSILGSKLVEGGNVFYFGVFLAYAHCVM